MQEKTPASAKTPDNIELDKDINKEYVVKGILQMKFSGQTKYLMKWKGYDTSENTWEPVKNLMNCWQLVQ
jgi:hypothetical protein